MTLAKRCIALLLLFLPILDYAQNRANNWYFSYDGILSFNSAPPAIKSENLDFIHDYAKASISNKEGELEFFVHGSLLFHSFDSMNYSRLFAEEYVTADHQGHLILPKPGNKQQYYIFSIADKNYNALPYQFNLYYFIYDQRADNGKGKIIKGRKILQKDVGFKLTSTLHNNGEDYWVLTHGIGNNKFYAFQLTASGLQPAVVSKTGSVHPKTRVGHRGEMKISPNGKKIGLVINPTNIIEFFTFNNRNGKVNDPIVKLNSIERSLNVQFTSCGDRFYFNVAPYNDSASGLYYYSLEKYNKNSIKSSLTKLPDLPTNSPWKDHIVLDLQLGIDGNLYITHFFDYSQKYYLRVMKDPSRDTPSLYFGHNIINLRKHPIIDDHPLGWDFPNISPHYFRYPLIDYESAICVGDTARFNFQNTCFFDSARWHFDDPGSGNNVAHSFDARHRYSDTGVYRARLIAWNSERTDTVFKQVRVRNARTASPFPPDTSLCQGDTLAIAYQEPYDELTWEGNSHKTFPVKISEKGTYNWKMENACGTYADSFRVTFHGKLDVRLSADTFICKKDSMMLEDLNGNRGQYTWSDGSADSTLSVKKAGLYWLKVTNKCGTGWDTTKVNFFREIAFPSDTSLCKGDSIGVSPYHDSLRYRWSNGSENAFIQPEKSGLYTLTVGHPACGKRKDSIYITLDESPGLSLSEEKVVCNDKTTTLRAAPGYEAYRWSTGDTTNQIRVQTGGTYTLKASKGACRDQQSTYVRFSRSPEPGLREEVTVCPREEEYATLRAGEAAYYEWHPVLSGKREITVKRPGSYRVIVRNEQGCRDTGTAEVTEACPGELYFPNAFSPNRDGINDEFKPEGEGIKAYRLTVYSRWGEKLFETDKVEEGWDGRFKGEKAPSGTYVYFCEYQRRTAEGVYVPELRHGSVELVD